MLGWMRRYLGIGVAWLGATALSVLIAAAAVAGIRDRVVDKPVAIGLPTTTTTVSPAETFPATPNPDTTPTTVESPATSTTVVTETMVAPAATDTTAAPVTTTTSPPPTSTTAPPTTAATTVQYQTVDLIGGTVILGVGDGELILGPVTPRPGFTVRYEEISSHEIEVEFISEDHKSKLEAFIEDGELKVNPDEESEGDHDGGGGGDDD